jgi:hypothetical protein
MGSVKRPNDAQNPVIGQHREKLGKTAKTKKAT